MIVQRCKPFLGTYVEIEIIDPGKSKNPVHAVDQAYDVINKINNLMSFHLSHSDLTKINQQACQHEVTVDPLTFEVLALAKDLFNLTSGAFDCAVAHYLQAQDLLPHCVDMQNIETKPTRNPSCSLDHLLLGHPFTVRFTKPLSLDLGGIAKGYAVDQACKVLMSCGIEAACVNAGGDLRIFGEHDTAIHIRNPLQPQQLIYAGQLRDGAFASSANYFTRQNQTAKLQSALIDTRTGEPISTQKSFSVIASSCAIADGLTKALAVDQEQSAYYFQYYDAQAFIL
jgi:thiamine biosynthesis lipoprotein